MGARVLVHILLCLLALGSAVTASFQSKRHVELVPREYDIADIPACGIQCLLNNVAVSTCAPSDFKCMCADDGLQKTVSSCLLANCTMNDMLILAKVERDQCDLSREDKSRDLLLCTVIAYTVAVVFTGLRVLSRPSMRQLRMDDWIIIAGLCVAAIAIGCVVKMSTIGFGKHLWDLEPGQLKQCLIYFYVAWSIYSSILGLVKISLVLLYLDIFPTSKARSVAYVLLAWILANSLVNFFVTIFNCRPVNAFWDRDVKGKCIDIQAFGYSASVFAIAQDIALLIYPLVCIRQLQMQRHRKIAVGVMFSIGTFGCIATILRLKSQVAFKTTIDPTWDYVESSMWTMIEFACAHVCVALPSIRILLGRIFPKSIWASMTRSRTRTTERSNTFTPKIELVGATPEPHPPKKSKFSCMQIDTDVEGSSPTSTNWSSKWSPRPWGGPAHPAPTKDHRRLGSTERISLTHLKTSTRPVPGSVPGSTEDLNYAWEEDKVYMRR